MLMQSIARENARTKVLVVTADAEFRRSAQETLSSSSRLDAIAAPNGFEAKIDHALLEGAGLIIFDIDSPDGHATGALNEFIKQMDGRCPIIVVTTVFHPEIARQLLQLKVADLLLKPVAPADLLRACTRVNQGAPRPDGNGAEIFTFLPASGGVGVTSLAIQTALLLQRHGQRGLSSTCLVDLDFQQGSCAHYLDLESRLDLDEI